MKAQNSFITKKRIEKWLSMIMVATIFFTSIPITTVYAEKQDVVGETFDNVGMDVRHEKRAGNTEADVYVKATASNADFQDEKSLMEIQLQDSRGNRIQSSGRVVDTDGVEEVCFRVNKNDIYQISALYGAGAADGFSEEILDEDMEATAANAMEDSVEEIFQYEVDDLYEKGMLEEVNFDVVMEEEELGAKITILAFSSNVEKQNHEIQIVGMTILEKDDDEFYDQTQVRAFEYQEAERELDQGTATFYISNNGTYYVGIAYKIENETTVKSLLLPYQVSSKHGIRYFGVENVQIQAGTAFDLMSGVGARDENEKQVTVGIAREDGFDAQVPGTYTITYAPIAELRKRSSILNNTYERTIQVLPRAVGDLQVSSDSHGTDAGKTMSVGLFNAKSGMFNISYKLPMGGSKRYLEFDLPNWMTVPAWPTTGYESVIITKNGDNTTYHLQVRDDNTAQTISFELQYISRPDFSHISGGVEEYIKKLGIVNLGDVKIRGGHYNSQGNQEVIATAEFTGFHTELFDGGGYVLPDLGIQTTSGFQVKGASHQAPVDTDGTIVFPSRSASGSAGDKFFINTSYQSKNPVMLEKLRVFAPEGFQLSVKAEYKDKIKIGQDTSGMWYAETTEMKNNMAVLAGLNLERDMSVVPSPGTYTSSPSILTYTTYELSGGTVVWRTNITVETTPLVSVTVGAKRIDVPSDLLELSGDNNGNTVHYAGSIYLSGRMYVDNRGRFLEQKNGIDYYSIPMDDGAGLVLSMKLPGVRELDLNQLSIGKIGDTTPVSSDSIVKVKNVGLKYVDGSIVTFLPSQVGLPSGGVLTDREHRVVFPIGTILEGVVAIEVEMDKLYQAEVGLNIKTMLNSAVEETLPPEGRYTQTEGISTISRSGNILKTTHYPSKKLMMPRKVWILGGQGAMGISTPMDLSVNTVIAKMDVKDALNTTVKDIKFIIDFTANNDDRMRYLNWITVHKPGTVEVFGTNGRKKTTEIKVIGSVSLRPFREDTENNYATKVIVTFPSVTSTSETDGLRNLLTLESSDPKTQEQRDAMIGYLKEDETHLRIKWDLSATSSAWTYNEPNQRMDIGILVDTGTMNFDKQPAVTRPEYTNYENDVFDYKLPAYEAVFKTGLDRWGYYNKIKPEYRWNYPGIFVFLDNEDSFSFTGVEAPWEYKKINTAQGTVIKLWRDGFEKKLRDPKSDTYKAQLPAPNLKFHTLAGGSTGRMKPIKGVWYDMESLPEMQNSWLYDNGARISVPEGNLIQGTDITTNMVVKRENSADFTAVNILKSTATGVFLSAGINGSYPGGTVNGYAMDRFNARVLLRTGSSSSPGYEAIIELPSPGSKVANASNQIYTSNYGMHLTGPAVVKSNGGTTLIAHYQISGSSAYVDAGNIQDWSQVQKIKLIPKTGSDVIANTDQLITLSLEAKEKTDLGSQFAYLGATYKTGGSSVVCDPVTYGLSDYTINIHGWNDSNENKKKDNEDTAVTGYSLKIKGNNTGLEQGTHYEIVGGATSTKVTIPDGRNLMISVDQRTLPLGTVLLPNQGTASDFDKVTGQLVMSELTGNDNFNLGVVTLGTITAGNVKVKAGQEAATTVKLTGLSATAPVEQYVYTYQVDKVAIASIANHIISGTSVGLTDVTVNVVNSFGDIVTTSFQVSVGSNQPPVIIPGDWIVIEGDNIPDIWTNATYYDMEDTFPPFRAGGMQKQTASQSKATVWTDATKSKSITLGNALNTPGDYVITYEVEDQDGNKAEADGKLEVYGALVPPVSPSLGHDYFPEGTNFTYSPVRFTYTKPDGSLGEEWVSQTVPITQSGQQTVEFTGIHPEIKKVNQTVEPGSGRNAKTQVVTYLDSQIQLVGIPKTTVMIVGTTLDLMDGITGKYFHYDLTGSVQETKSMISITNSGVTLISNNITPSAIGSSVYTYVGSTAEVYANGANEKTEDRIIEVIGKTVLENNTMVYVTPDQAKDEEYVKSVINATASYVDAKGGKQTLDQNQITYRCHMSDGIIQKVDVNASVTVGGTINAAEERSITVQVREIPEIQADLMAIRVDAANIDPDEGVTISPNDKNNTYVVKSNSVDKTTPGVYTIVYTVTDNLTGASADYTRLVYVNGNPEIKANPVSLNTHQAVDEAALIDAVKAGSQGVSPSASVSYADPNNKLKKVVIPEADIMYSLDNGFVPQQEGEYLVMLTVSDKNIITSAVTNIEPTSTTISVAVTVSNRSYAVEITSGDTQKGTFVEGSPFFPKDVVHGGSIDDLPTPKGESGYHFDGYLTKQNGKAKEDILLKNGTTILAGDTIPAGSILSEEQIKNLIVEENLELEAMFSATPELSGNSVQLYENEVYHKDLLGIRVRDLDDLNGTDGAIITVDDSHVNVGIPGIYQTKVTATDNQGNVGTTYLYVQIYGKPQITANVALNLRKGDSISLENIMENIDASYQKPMDIPGTPWSEEDKTNIIVTEEVIEITKAMTDTALINSNDVGLKKVIFQIPGAILGKEELGSTTVENHVRIHGSLMIEADYNELFTHLAVNQEALTRTIETGIGSGIKRQPTTAYMEVVGLDGTVEKVFVETNKINYRVNDFVPLTQGQYKVIISADDSEILKSTGLAQVGLVPMVKTLERGVAVGTRFHETIFVAGTNGSFVGGNSIKIPTAHGMISTIPEVVPDEGYEFEHWVDGNGGVIGDISKYPIVEGTTITANFKKKVFTVQFVGKANRVIKTEIVKFKEHATAPTTDPDVTNSRFIGWDKEFSSVTSNLVVTAKYRSDSGSGGGSGEKPQESKPAESQPQESKPAESQPQESKPAESQPQESKPAESQPQESKPAESQPQESKPNSNKPEGGTTNGGGHKNPTFDLDENKTPLGSLDFGVDSVYGRRLPRLDDNKPIQMADGKETNKENSNTVEIRKTGGKEGNGNEKQEQEERAVAASNLPQELTPKDLMEKTKKCIIHWILLGVTFLELMYLFLKNKKNKKEIENLEKTRGEEMR